MWLVSIVRAHRMARSLVVGNHGPHKTLGSSCVAPLWEQLPGTYGSRSTDGCWMRLLRHAQQGSLTVWGGFGKRYNLVCGAALGGS
jgi:hypothetical protein